MSYHYIKDYHIDIVNDKLVLRMTRGNNSVSVGEQELRKKIYHAPDFGIALPRDLDLALSQVRYFHVFEKSWS